MCAREDGIPREAEFSIYAARATHDVVGEEGIRARSTWILEDALDSAVWATAIEEVERGPAVWRTSAFIVLQVPPQPREPTRLKVNLRVVDISSGGVRVESQRSTLTNGDGNDLRGSSGGEGQDGDD